MLIDRNKIEQWNQKKLASHKSEFDFIASKLSARGFDVNALVKKISNFKVATPSWALGSGGTRFGRFPMGGEPGNLTQKMEDVARWKSFPMGCSKLS